MPREFIIDTKTPTSAPTYPINNKYYHHVDTISGIASDPVDGSGLITIEIAIKKLSENTYWNGSVKGYIFKI